MKSALALKASLYLAIAAGHATLFISSDLPEWMTWPFMALLAVSWFVETPRRYAETSARVWNMATFILLLWVIVDNFILEGEFFLNLTGLLFFITLNKLFNRWKPKDSKQLLLFSLLALLAGSALVSSVLYAPCFLIFVPSSIVTLVLLHLQNEAGEDWRRRFEQEPAFEQMAALIDGAGVLSWRWLAGVMTLAGAVFAVTLLLFIAIPRVGMGLFQPKVRAGQSTTGFSDQVEIGAFGLIRNDPAVVMRAEIEGMRGSSLNNIYWRGQSFDHFDGRRWHSTDERLLALFMNANGVYPLERRKDLRGAKLTEIRIYQEPMDTRLLFGADRIMAVNTSQMSKTARMHFPQKKADGDILYGLLDGASRAYTVYSDLSEPDPDVLRAAGERYPRYIYRMYLQTPAFSPRMAELADQITAGKETAYDKARAIEQHLSTRFKYTTDLGTNDDESDLEFFLFNRKAGHCVYFSTAFVMLARLAGVPARNVNGFLGADWNELGQYYAVRKGYAHSWAEVFFPGEGWIRFEPTPSSALMWGGAMGNIFDAVRNTWNRWVLEFDLGTQFSIFKSLKMAFSGGGEPPAANGPFSGKRDLKQEARKWGVILAPALLMAAALFLIWRWHVSGPDRQQPRGAAQARGVRLYERFLDQLARKGVERQPGDTVESVLRAMERASLPPHALNDAAIITNVYQAARFSRRPPTRAEFERAETALARFARRPQ